MAHLPVIILLVVLSDGIQTELLRTHEGKRKFYFLLSVLKHQLFTIKIKRIDEKLKETLLTDLKCSKHCFQNL